MEQPKAKALTLLAFAILLLAAHLIGGTRTLSFLILFAVATQAYLLGNRWLASDRLPQRILWGAFGTVAVLMLARGAWFYLGFSLNEWGRVGPVIITLIMGSAWLFFDKRDVAHAETKREEPVRFGAMIVPVMSAVLSLAALTLISYAAWKSGTSESIRTPWPLLPEWTLPLIALQWIFALICAWKIGRALVSAIQVGAAIASTTFIAPLLYTIGYGFDGFLHIAGERVLLETGTLVPKPAYYIGQYVLTTWISDILEFNIASVDRWLVPAAAAILIPAAVSLVAKRRDQITWFLALILAPVSAFVATTPHGFAMILGFTALLLCIPSDRTHAARPYALPAILFALWSALTHPLVGLPVLFAVIMANVFAWNAHRAQRDVAHTAHAVIAWILAIAAGFSVPLVFGLATWISSSASVSFDAGNLLNPDAWRNLAASWIPWVPNRYAIWPEASVWIEKLLPWITLLFAALAVIRSKKSEPSQTTRSFLDNAAYGWITAAASTAFAAIILNLAGDFNFLIDYERGNYAERLWVVAWILLLPIAIPELGKWLARAKQASGMSLIGLLIAFGTIGAGMSYAALPRHDAATASRGWSVGRADIEAVRLIEKDSGDRDYTVLANQSVSAAAVREYGFKRYHDGVFFYPIPTGGELYEVFLCASYDDPSRETMSRAGQLGGSDLVYLVVNDYWWDADALIQKARETANRTFEVADGKTTIFKYDPTEPIIIEECKEK